MPFPSLSGQQVTIGISIVGLIAIISLIFCLLVGARLSTVHRKLRKWQKIHETADLDAIYEKTLESVAELKEENHQLRNRIVALQEALKGKVNAPIIYRYNAFSDMGSDLSYSTAILDDKDNGIVLTSIYGREVSHTYGKPVESGASSYTLTEEEKKAIRMVQAVQTGQGSHPLSSHL